MHRRMTAGAQKGDLSGGDPNGHSLPGAARETGLFGDLPLAAALPQETADGEEIIEGVVENVIFSNESNGYSVCELGGQEGEPVILVGIMPYLNAGESIKARGRWETHASYGKQFKVEYYEKQLPVTSEAIVKYLSSGMIKGIGGVTAKRIVEQFGEDTFDVIESHPEWLTDIRGISPKKAQEISEGFKSQFGVRSIMLFCRDFFGPATVMKIYKKWGSGAIDTINRNPYILCDEIYGIGFDRADRLASSIGFARDSAFRIASGIKYALSYNANNNGHMFIPRDKLIGISAELLGVDASLVEAPLIGLENAREVVSVTLRGRACTYLRDYYDAERYTVDKMILLDRLCEKTAMQDIDYMINQIEAEEGVAYARLQRKAIVSAVNNGVMLLTGGPGTGKTTIIRAVIRIYRRMGFEIALAAPTGRAAKRMSEATQCEAKTIHRLLDMEYLAGERTKFRRNEHNLLEEDVVIIDEASMIDSLLMASLLKAIKPGGRLMLIGDADQLPSVGAGNVLCDLLASERFPTVRLTEIFRQAQESRIITNAHAINNGELPVLTDKRGDFFFLSREREADIVPTIVDLCRSRLPKTYGEKIRDAIQVITPSHKGTAGTESLNGALQAVLNFRDGRKKEKKFRNLLFREGDKVMQIKNNYEIEWERYEEKGSGIFNGDIGFIEAIDYAAEQLCVNFDGRICRYEFAKLDELEHAYAITIHKSQGSEYPVVIMPLFRCAPRLLTRNLFYTAVTRAQKIVILVGSAEIVQTMVENNRLAKRYTGLRDMLEQA